MIRTYQGHTPTIPATCYVDPSAQVIGEGSIIAAGAVIPEGMVVPPRSLVAGVPGKIRRDLTSDDREDILQYARNYLDYVKIYLGESEPAHVKGFLEEMKIAK